jgi:hypothetical protein
MTTGVHRVTCFSIPLTELDFSSEDAMLLIISWLSIEALPKLSSLWLLECPGQGWTIDDYYCQLLPWVEDFSSSMLVPIAFGFGLDAIKFKL